MNAVKKAALAVRRRIRDLLRGLLLMYHCSKAKKEVDLAFYAVTLNFTNKDLPLADLFSGFLCKEQVKWQALLLFFAVYNVFAIPFTISVSQGTWPEGQPTVLLLEIFEGVGDMFFILEVFFNFYLPYEEEGVQINIHSLISRKYVRGWLAIDVVGALPLVVVYRLFWGAPNRQFFFLRLNKLVRFFRLNFYWGRMEKNLLDMNPSLIRLGKFVFLFFLAAHWVACLWLEVVRLEGWPGAQKWVGLDDFDDEGIWGTWPRYYQAYYWALVTMVGYGGSVPQTPQQAIFSFLVVGVGVVMYVVVIGTVGTIVLNLDTQENAHRQKIEHVNDFFKLRHVPPGLAGKVRTYYDFMWRSRQGIDSIATVNDLPQYLKMEISSYLCQDMMSKVPLFQGADEQFLRQLAASLRPMVCLPNTMVVTKGEMGKEMYFVSKGSLEVLIEFEKEDGTLDTKAVCTLKEGQHFGEIALLCRSKRSASIKSKEFCDLFMLKADDFRQLMLESKEVSTLIRKQAMRDYPSLRPQLKAAFGEEGEDCGWDEEFEEEETEENEEGEEDVKERAGGEDRGDGSAAETKKAGECASTDSTRNGQGKDISAGSTTSTQASGEEEDEDVPLQELLSHPPLLTPPKPGPPANVFGATQVDRSSSSNADDHSGEHPPVPGSPN